MEWWGEQNWRQWGVRLAGKPLAQGPHQARLADAGLAREQDHLAFALLRPLPAVEQQPKLLLPPDQGREAGRAQGLEAALGRALADDREGAHRPRESLERPGAQVSRANRLPSKRRVPSAMTTVPGPRSPAAGPRSSAACPPQPSRAPPRRPDRSRPDRWRCRPAPGASGRAGVRVRRRPRRWRGRHAPISLRRPRRRAGSRSRRECRHPCTSRHSRRSRRRPGRPRRRSAIGARPANRRLNAPPTWKPSAHLSKGLELIGTRPDTQAQFEEELALCLAIGGPLTATKGYSAVEVERTYSRASAICRAAWPTGRVVSRAPRPVALSAGAGRTTASS